MSSLESLLIFYIYKGNSYLAKYRINAFIDDLKNNQELWDNFNHLSKMNREIKIADIPSLGPLITKIFVNKN
jgi:hypothetical protein